MLLNSFRSNGYEDNKMLSKLKHISNDVWPNVRVYSLTLIKPIHFGSHCKQLCKRSLNADTRCCEDPLWPRLLENS